MSRLFYPLAEKIRRNQPLPPGLGPLLQAATVGVRVGMWLRLRQTPVRVGVRVISFGNITAGGTGKTPAVIERARAELAAGRRVGVLTRGYRSRRSRKPVAVNTAQPQANLYALLGDEPALIARKCPGAVIVKCADRVAAAQMAVDEFGCDTLILDDAFQHVRLARDENVCVIDASDPFGNGHLVPRGTLREGPESIRRATHILLTHCDRARHLDVVPDFLNARNPDAPMRMTRHAPSSLWRVADGEQAGLETLRGRPVTAACAIAAPESFFQTLRGLGAQIERELAFPDHATLPADALQAPGLVVVTEKDAVKLAAPPENVYALAIELQDWPGAK